MSAGSGLTGRVAFARTTTTKIIDSGMRAVIKRKSAKGNTSTKSVRRGGISVSRVVTALQVTVQMHIWSVTVARLIPVVALTEQVQTVTTLRRREVREVQEVRVVLVVQVNSNR